MKKGVIARIWEALGGKKFMAVIIGTGVVFYRGDLPTNFLLLLCAYMGANILNKYVDGKSNGSDMVKIGGGPGERPGPPERE
jgi:hypothetical protein